MHDEHRERRGRREHALQHGRDRRHAREAEMLLLLLDASIAASPPRLPSMRGPPQTPHAPFSITEDARSADRR